MTARPASVRFAFASAAAALLLTGCTFSPGQSAGPRIDADEVAATAAAAYEEQYGVSPQLDCGDEPVPLQVGARVVCVLTAGGLEYDAVITMVEVTGSTYSIDMTVADVPTNAAPPTVAPSDPGSAPVIAGADLAGYVTQALAPQLGFVPQDLACADIEVSVGTVASCSYSDAAGEHEVEVRITAFDGETFNYTATVLD